MHNLRGPAFSKFCQQFRGVEKFQIAGLCETHTMHPRRGEGGESERVGDVVEGETASRSRGCSGCRTM